MLNQEFITMKLGEISSSSEMFQKYLFVKLLGAKSHLWNLKNEQLWFSQEPLGTVLGAMEAGGKLFIVKI